MWMECRPEVLVNQLSSNALFYVEVMQIKIFQCEGLLRFYVSGINKIFHGWNQINRYIENLLAAMFDSQYEVDLMR